MSGTSSASAGRSSRFQSFDCRLVSSVTRPIKELKGFQRVHLEAGEEKQITIPVRLADLDYFQMDSSTATTGKWVVESGNINIMVGGSSTSLPLSMTVPVTGY